MRKIIGFFCFTVLLFLSETLCFALSNIVIEVDGNEVNFEQPPVIDNGRTLIPLRGVFDKLSCSVEWDSVNKSISIKKGNDAILVKIGEKFVYKNGVISSEIDVPAKIINGRTMIPVRGILELFDNYITWNESERTVEIYSPYGDNVSIDLLKISDSNKALRLLEYNFKLKNTEFVLGNNCEWVYSNAIDNKLKVHVINSDFEAYSNGARYYEKTNSGDIYEFAEINDNNLFFSDIESYLPSNPDVAWSYIDSENVVFAVEKDGKYYVKTEVLDFAYIPGLAESVGVENKGKYICRFIVKADTFEILSSESYQLIDGIEKNILSLKIEKNVYDNLDFINEINSREKCRINFNLKFMDTDLTKSIKDINFNKGYCLNFFGMEKYNIYGDENCTVLYDFNRKIVEDKTINLYLRSKN